METISYVLPVILVALGLLCGFILGRIAKEELRPGKKYFILLQKIFFVVVIFLMMYTYRETIHSVWIGAIILLAYLHYFNNISQWTVYILFGVIYKLCFGTEIFPFVISGMFLYGFPTGSLNIKDKQKLAICAVVFLIVSLGLGFA